RQIVDMGHVLTRLSERVVLPEEEKPLSEEITDLEDNGQRLDHDVVAEEFRQIVNAGILDGEPAVHEGLAELQRAVQQKFARYGVIVEADGNGFPGLFPCENVQLIIGID